MSGLPGASLDGLAQEAGEALGKECSPYPGLGQHEGHIWVLTAGSGPHGEALALCQSSRAGHLGRSWSLWVEGRYSRSQKVCMALPPRACVAFAHMWPEADALLCCSPKEGLDPSGPQSAGAESGNSVVVCATHVSS